MELTTLDAVELRPEDGTVDGPLFGSYLARCGHCAGAFEMSTAARAWAVLRNHVLCEHR